MNGEELLTLAVVLGLISIIVLGTSAFVITTATTETATGSWIVYSASPSLEGTDNTYKIDGLSIRLEGITAVDYFYKPSGEKGIIGVKLTLKNTSDHDIYIPLKDAFFINVHGKKIMTEVMSGYKNFSEPPSMLKLSPSQEYKLSLVAKKSQQYVKIGNTSMWLVTLLAKENGKIKFSIPLIENGKEVFYEFKLKFAKKQ